MMAGYVYDLAQLIHQQKLAPVTLVAHSLGGNIALRYTGLYPENVAKLIAIEGLGPSPKMLAERHATAFPDRMRAWIEEQRGLSGRMPRRYATIEDAWRRMREENKHLSPEQARHLTQHGVLRSLMAALRHARRGCGRALAAHLVSDAAGLRQGELGLQSARGWPGEALPERRGRHFRGRRPLGASR
jgi:pimeloyl-ACP methyl ester carboxylesterase